MGDGDGTGAKSNAESVRHSAARPDGLENWSDMSSGDGVCQAFETAQRRPQMQGNY